MRKLYAVKRYPSDDAVAVFGCRGDAVYMASKLMLPEGGDADGCVYEVPYIPAEGDLDAQVALRAIAATVS